MKFLHNNWPSYNKTFTEAGTSRQQTISLPCCGYLRAPFLSCLPRNPEYNIMVFSTCPRRSVCALLFSFWQCCQKCWYSIFRILWNRSEIVPTCNRFPKDKLPKRRNSSRNSQHFPNGKTKRIQLLQDGCAFPGGVPTFLVFQHIYLVPVCFSSFGRGKARYFLSLNQISPVRVVSAFLHAPKQQWSCAIRNGTTFPE